MERMSSAQRALWERIENFELDVPHAPHPFSCRLARENSWSPERTRRVVREYRRFLFLAIEAGHPVSPSEDVDEAWHLHLLYSRSYWDELCGKVLMQPLHHEPGQGKEDARKFHDWYGRTLDSYERFFGEAPPREIWPGASDRWKNTPLPVRVDRRRFWIVPKPRIGVKPWAASLLVLLATGCGNLLEVGGPWDLSGPEFLELYAILFFGVLSVALAIRYIARAGAPKTYKEKGDLSPYEAAYLAGEGERTVSSAVTSLVHRGHLERKAPPLRTVEPGEPLPEDAHPLEKAIVKTARNPFSASFRYMLQGKDVVRECQALDESLVSKGMLLSPRKAFLVRLTTAGMFFLLLLLGISKMVVGAARNRPVGFLVVFCVLTAALGVALLFWKTRRTRLGMAALEKQRSKHASWASRGRIDTATSALAVTWAVALFGPEILNGSPLHTLVADYMTLPQRSGTATDVAGGGCSAGGCGGGGGGGGGGGCGGGGGGGGGGGCGGGCGGCGGG